MGDGLVVVGRAHARGMIAAAVRAAILMGLALVASVGVAAAQLCGDANGDGSITDTDGVNVLRAAASLSSSCGPSVRCDVNGDGSITDTDGVNVLRAAAGLPAELDCTGPGPGPGPQVDPIIASLIGDDGEAATYEIGGTLTAPSGASDTVGIPAIADALVAGRVNTITVPYDVGGALARAAADDVSLLVQSRDQDGVVSPGFFDLPLTSANDSVTIALQLRNDPQLEQFGLAFANGSGGSVIGEVVKLVIPVVQDVAAACGNRVLDGEETCDPPGTRCGVESTRGFCGDTCACQESPPGSPQPTPTPECGNGDREPGELCDGQDAALCEGQQCLDDCTCAPIVATATPTASPSPSPTPACSFVTKWGSTGTAPGAFQFAPTDIIAGNTGVFVIEAQGRVHRFSATGQPLGTLQLPANPVIPDTRGIGFDASRRSLLVADAANGGIDFLTETLTTARPFLGLDVAVVDAVTDPRGSTTHPLFFIEESLTPFTEQGYDLNTGAALGVRQTFASRPTHSAIASDGSTTISFSDSGELRLGTLVVPGLKAPHGVAVDSFSEAAYVAERDLPRIAIYDRANGALLGAFGSLCRLSNGAGCVDPDGPGPLQAGDGQFAQPVGVAAAAFMQQNFVYVVEAENRRVQKFLCPTGF